LVADEIANIEWVLNVNPVSELSSGRITDSYQFVDKLPAMGNSNFGKNLISVNQNSAEICILIKQLDKKQSITN